MDTKQNIGETIVQLAGEIENDAVKRHRENGGGVLGYSCVFTPVEVIEAAGLFPYRIRALGNPNTDLADARLSRFNCSFCRSCLQLGLDGTYDFLDGLIETNGCDQLRGMFENWVYAKEVPFFHYLKAPHILSEDAMAYFADELRRMKEAIEEKYSVEITEEKLRTAIEAQERIRGKLRQVYSLREAADPKVTGTESLQLILAGSALPAAEFEDLLDRFLAEKQNATLPKYRARLLLGGAATDEIEFVEEVERMGGFVATDSFCFGTRAFWPAIDTKAEDPYRAMAELYLGASKCPRMYEEFPARLEFILDAAKRATVDGVVLVHNKFCDVHGIDNALLRIRLEEAGVPTLMLEKEYGSAADVGRMKTRIQAFLERIGA
jgi:benzoyl-CoA reductase subunit C